MTKRNLIAAFVITAPVLVAAAVPVAAAPRVGDLVRADGTTYAGVDPDTKKQLYTTEADEPGLYDWYGAKARCPLLGPRWSVPTAAQLGQIYNQRAVIGGFNKRGSNPHGMYWASTTHPDNRDDARLQYFGDGDRYWGSKEGNRARVRCVRN